MKKLLMGAALAVSLLAAAPAANAVIVVPLPAPAADGSITAAFGNSPIGAGPFADTYQFTFPTGGVASTAVTSIRVNAATNIDFTSVKLNGTPFTITNGTFDIATLLDQPVSGGLQTLYIAGISGGNGEYTVDLAFAPVPEPATWAMMIVGFTGAGLMLRGVRRKALAPVV